MDHRIERSQQLFWEVRRLRELGAYGPARPKLAEMALIHEELARELLDRAIPDAWIDLFAAITAWAEAGRKRDAQRLIAYGRQWLPPSTDARDNVERELSELADWVDSLHVVPALSCLSPPLPPLLVGAA